MRKLLLSAIAIGALVVPLAVTASPAAARPLTGADLLTVADAAEVYPSLRGGDRVRGRFGIVAPRYARVDGRLRCDRYRSIRGAVRRNVSIFHASRARAVALDQDVVRFRRLGSAKGVLRHYRDYVETCRGTHPTTDGEGGNARLRVRGWDTPRVGAGSVGLLIGFAQHGETTWRRTVVARTKRTVSVQTIEPRSGTSGPRRAVRISRDALAKLR